MSVVYSLPKPARRRRRLRRVGGVELGVEAERLLRLGGGALRGEVARVRDARPRLCELVGRLRRLLRDLTDLLDRLDGGIRVEVEANADRLAAHAPSGVGPLDSSTPPPAPPSFMRAATASAMFWRCMIVSAIECEPPMLFFAP
jgi:hypothetical protein